VAQLDAVICPAHALPAVRHGAYTDITFSASYTLLYNLLDWPAGVVPITHVKSTDTAASIAAVPLPDGFRPGMLDRKIERAYNAADSEGLPVGVQVVTPPFQDEVCTGVMQVIESTRALPRSAFLCPQACNQTLKSN
jgi:fatty acid amide hydrolase